jgi:hypothetical protein
MGHVRELCPTSRNPREREPHNGRTMRKHERNGVNGLAPGTAKDRKSPFTLARGRVTRDPNAISRNAEQGQRHSRS